MKLSLQYLEDSPELAGITPEAARERLRGAFAHLPVDYLLLGWNVPGAVAAACVQESTHAGAAVYRWHTLLTGERDFVPRPEWRVLGVDGEPVPVFRGLPEFTFICPNRPAARAAALAHLRSRMRWGGYRGVFLDRIRYPSPVADPGRFLGCFCPDCRRAAAAEGLDLETVRTEVKALAVTPEGARVLVGALLDPEAEAPAGLRAFLAFRVRSVTSFVREAAALVRAQGLGVGLDCFAPALTYMVGQDLAALDPCGNWVKVMTYGHTLGPAGIPFELLHLADWLSARAGLSEEEALAFLTEAARLDLPESRAALDGVGLAPVALSKEVRRGREAGVRTLLAGMELVQLQGVTRLSPAQIAADLDAFHAAGVDGLVLSWDLWHMPEEWLALVGGGRRAWRN